MEAGSEGEAKRDPQQASTTTTSTTTAVGRALVETSTVNPQVYALAKVLRKQREEDHQLALANHRLGSVNLLLGVANYSRNQYLAKEQDAIKERIKEGRKVVRHLEGELQQHEKKLDSAENEIATNRTKVGDLEENIQQLAEKYDEELAAQRKMLTEQKRELLQMTLSMFNQDLTVDSSILLLAWVLTNTPMVDWPLRLVTVGTAALPVLPLRKARRQWVISRFARLFVLLMLSRTLRVGAIRRGWHNSIGTPQAYVAHLLDLLRKYRQKENAPTSVRNVKLENSTVGSQERSMPNE